MDVFFEYLKAFAVGGLICVIGQLLIDHTKLTPARILVGFVVTGVILGAVGLYEPLVNFAGAGATVPLTGFGYNLAKGVKEAGWRLDLEARSSAARGMPGAWDMFMREDKK